VLTFLGYHVCKAFVEGCCLGCSTQMHPPTVQQTPHLFTGDTNKPRSRNMDSESGKSSVAYSPLWFSLQLVAWEGSYIKSASCDAFQKPLARMSKRAPSLVFAERAVILSPLSGWNGGSVATLLQTSVRSEAVMSRISL